jgi:hypothetical protein
MGELQCVNLTCNGIELTLAVIGGPEAGHGLARGLRCGGRSSLYFVRPCSVNPSTPEEELFVKTINWSKTDSYVAWVMLSCVHSRRGPRSDGDSSVPPTRVEA